MRSLGAGRAGVPDRRFGIALLGCGGIASYYHLPVLTRLPSARVVAVADPARSARDRARSIDGALAVEADAGAVLDRADVDAVVICAENTQHAPLALRALAAGKHVYLEKPLALTLEDGRAILSQATAAGVLGVIGFNLRFHPLHQQAHSLLRQGVIGDVRAVRVLSQEPARRRRMPEWKRRRSTGGGALLDLASHSVDLIRWHLGTEVVHAEATLGSRHTEHDVAGLRLLTESGVPADVHCRLGAAPADVFEVEGTLGALRVDRCRGRLWVQEPRPLANPSRSVLARVRSRLWPRPEPSFEHALAAFLDRLGGARRELPTLADGLRSLEALLAAERAAL
jgi:myo-inositol 2-dehydrogenase/D-chiro-inositol 1-dehydrogenase